MYAKKNDWLFPLNIEALGESDYDVLITAGKRDVECLKNVVPPKNVKIVSDVYQPEVLKNASVFLTHSGAGGSIEAVRAGVPMVCFPAFADQVENARVTDALGVGKWFKVIPSEGREVTIERIRKTVMEVVENPSNKDSILHFQQKINPLQAREEFLKNVREMM